MKLKFKIQQYQTDAVESTVSVFNGQPNLGLLEYRVDKGKEYVAKNGELESLFEYEFDSDIFTQEKHANIDHAYSGKKSIVDYVFTDSDGEKKFVGNIDTAKEVVVYAKLPKDFHIPTPVGNYSPDWAIAFQEGAVKHIYFVAETKGSMSSMDLRDIEKGKIACAEKLFEQLSFANIKYGKVDNFDTLMDLVK